MRIMRVTFFIEYHTRWGQQLFLSGGIEALGSGNEERALPMQYVDDGWWTATIDATKGVHLLMGICCAKTGYVAKSGVGNIVSAPLSAFLPIGFMTNGCR